MKTERMSARFGAIGKSALVAVAICVAAPLSSFAAAKSATLKAAGYTSSTTLTDFQALVKLSEGDDYGFSYNEAGGSSHYIWFTSADGTTVYPHEIDKWDTSGDSFVWVRLPELASGTTFKMHWSDSASDVQSASGNVWDGYVGVWHMNETGTTAEPDSTANGLNAVPYITSGTANINSDANGKVGSGRANIANANLRVSNYKDTLTTQTAFTMSGWFKQSATNNSWPRLFVGNPSNGDRTCWELWRESASALNAIGNGTSKTVSWSVSLGTDWHYLTLVYNGTTATLYDNGVGMGDKTINTPQHKTYLSIGGAGTTADRSFVGTFDEVRMYNGAMTADRVAADYATMNDPTAFITLASAPQAATLTHRWSFNTDGYDYTDSITGAAPASKFGNDGSRKTQGGKLVLTGSGSGQGSLGLGKNLLGSGDATVEIWASHDAVKNYARVFDYGNGSYGKNPNQTDCFIFAWSAGTEVSRDIVLLKKANATAFERHGTMSAMEWGKQYYFAVTFKDNDDGSSTIKWMRRDAVTGALERYKEETVSGWTLATLAATNPDFWLGVSKYNSDHDANASYDEVRIWNGALGEDQLAANAAMGPNAFTTGLSEGFNLAADAVFRVPSAGYTASGPVTLGAGSKLLFDTASFDGQSITFSATGFTVPSGGILDYVELTDSVNFTATLSGNAITVTRNASAPVTAQWTGASAPASAADLAVAANWTCYDASGTVVPNVVPGAATTIVIPDCTTSFTIPSDATPTWAGIRFGGHSGTKWGQNGSNGTGSSYTWRDTALKDYAFKGDGDLANLTGANTTWQTTNMKAKRVRFDGWVNIPAEKAGRWYLSQAFDDYFTFAIDGEWVLHSNNYNYYTYLNYDVTPGWHRFTVVCGDTSGGFGSGGITVGGVKVPFSFSVNGGAAQRFDQLTQGSGNSTVQLAADCDWSALGTINLSNGTVIDLNGHNLTIYDATADFLGAMVTNTSATTSTLYFGRDYASSAAGIQELVKGVGSSIIVAQKGAIVPDWTWTGAQDATFATAGNWAKGASVATDLAGAVIGLPSGVSQTFSYVTWDPVALSTTTFLVEGSAAFNDVGGFYLRKIMIEATGRIVYDPTKFTFRLVLPPAFASGAKIALASKYAANTKGRFLLMTWDSGSLEMDAAALTDVFDTSSANGTNPKVWAENLEGGGGRLWLDLDYGATKVRVNVLPVGDSITHGNDNGWGNWRTGLMKKLAAAGYEPIAKGHRFDQSHDICGATMPDEWINHSGIGAQRLITAGGGAGTIDAIENFLDQAGDVDFVLCKLGTNDICGNTQPETLYAAWTNLAWKILNQKPAVKLIAGAVVDIDNATWNPRVISYNSMVSNAIASAMFPAKRAYFADLYTPCYRRDSNGNYIEGTFYDDGVNTLHPDWPNTDKIADAYCASILGALADDPGFTPGQAEANVPTTSGAENNVPSAYLDGFARARVLDVAAYNGTNLATRGSVPYEDYSGSTAVTQGIGRVGYYIELKRKDDGVHQYHGLTRWLWVSMDAFGDRTIDTVGVPLTKVYQGAAAHLKVASNMPGIGQVAADGEGADGWIEFWPSSYSEGGSGLAGAPANQYKYDWNDTRADNMSGWGSMQVHLLTPGASNPAQVLFAFNGWTKAGGYEIGLGNLANQYLGSMDWTFSSDASKFGGAQRMSAAAYEVARIEVWTAAPAEHKTARWTGAGDGESLDSPANWRVTLGETVFDNAIPDGDTIVLIEGQGIALQIPAGSTLTCAGFEIGDCTLAADCDWRGLSVKPTITGTADLNGHNLLLAHLAADYNGAFANGVAATTSEVQLTVPDASYTPFGDGTFIENGANLSVASNVRIALVKEGDGTFSSSGFSLGTQAYEVDFVQTNGTANHTSAQIGISGHHGVYRMSGGTVKATGDFEVGPNGVGEFLQSGGSVTLQNWFNIGRYKNGNGTYTITGGSLLVNKASNGGADKVYVGNASNSSGTLNVGGSGQVQFSCHLSLGSQLDGNGGKGYVNVSGNGNLLTTGNIWIGQTGGETGEFRQTGGIAQCNGTTYVCNEDNSSGLLDISGTGEYRAAGGMTVGANGTLNVHDGGRLVAKSISTSKSTAKATFDGGTVVLTNITDGASLFGGFSSITVGAGGLTLDTAGHNVTMANGGLLAAQGSSIVKDGEGTLSVGSLPQVDTVSVAKGTLALGAGGDNASMLAHRWSFTSDLTDSVTGTAGTMSGSGASYEDGVVKLPGGNKDTCYIDLGANKLPSDSVTIEAWFTLRSQVNWTRVFVIGGSSGHPTVFNSRRSDNGNACNFDSLNGTQIVNTSGKVLAKDTPYYVAVTYTPDGNGGVIEKQYVKKVGDSGFIWDNTVTRANWSVTANAAQGYFWLGHSGSNSDPDTNIDFDEVRVWSVALDDTAIALSVEKGVDATAAEIADIAANVGNAAALRAIDIASGATLSIGAGNTLVQPVVTGGGTVSGGTLKVANELLVTDLDDCLIVDGGTFDIDGAKVVFSAAARQALAATGRTYTLVSAVNGGTITGSPLQAIGLPPGWRVKTTSSSMILRKDGMSIHIR